MKYSFRAGFTFVELLVVIAIIGILAAVLTASFGEARELARDEARKSNLKELQLALELYRSQNGRYPAAGCGRGDSWTGEPSSYGNCDEYIVGHAAGINFVPDYIADLPIETVGNDATSGYIYQTDLTGSTYKLMAHQTVESQLIQSFADELARCPYQCSASANCNGGAPPADQYAVYSAGAECI